MTKLTKEQIEQERVKFEECFLNLMIEQGHEKLASRNVLDKTENNDSYIFNATENIFSLWLARAELDKGE